MYRWKRGDKFKLITYFIDTNEDNSSNFFLKIVNENLDLKIGSTFQAPF